MISYTFYCISAVLIFKCLVLEIFHLPKGIFSRNMLVAQLVFKDNKDFRTEYV
jgi:hypothetical protein